MRDGGAARGRSEGAATRSPATAAPWGAVVLAAAALATLGLAACAKKVTSVDASFTAPEGVASAQAGLTVYRELPNHLYLFERGNPGADPPIPDKLVDSVTVATPIPGQLHGVIRDSTASSTYQVFRREPNGGYRTLYDFLTQPAHRWFDRGWEVYSFADADSEVPTRTYRARGVVGAPGTGSPLTNEANDVVRAVQNITYTGVVGGLTPSGHPIALDSLFVMQWLQVPNAAGYYIDVYQWGFNLVSLGEQIASGAPAPLYIGKSHDLLVAYLPAPPTPAGSTVSFQMPKPDERPPNARVLTCRETRLGQQYLVRIAAEDASGQLIAYTYGSFSQQLTGDIGYVDIPSTDYAVFPMGAVLIQTSAGGTTAPSRARRSETPSP